MLNKMPSYINQPLFLNLIIIGLYMLAGYISSFLAFSPSYASPFSPGAGIALGALIVFGSTVLSGVFFGAIIVQVLFYSSIDSEIVEFSKLNISLLTAIALTVQAYVGMRWVKPILEADPGLLNARSIISFLLIASPVSCIIAASVHAVLNLLYGYINFNDYSLAWMTWWVGDSLGVMIFTPIILCFFSEPKILWHQRIRSVAMPIFMMAAASFVVLYISYNHQLNQLSYELKRDAEQFNSLLLNDINANIEVVSDLTEFFNNSEQVTGDEFVNLTTDKLARNKQIESIQWISNFTDEQKLAFQKTLENGEVQDIKNQQRIISPDKNTYWSIQDVVSLTNTQLDIGYDIKNNMNIYQAALKACQSNTITASNIINAPELGAQESGILFFSPVYERFESDTKLNHLCEHMIGFASSYFNIEKVVNLHRENLSQYHILVSLKSEHENIFSDLSDNSRVLNSIPKQLVETFELHFADKTWLLEIKPNLEFITEFSYFERWLVNLGCFLVVSLCAMGFLLLSGRAMLTENLVKQRTTELEHEINERDQSSLILSVENKALQMIADKCSLDEILETISIKIEEIIKHSHFCIFLIDKDKKHLQIIKAPSLSEEYKKLVNGIEIGPDSASSGTAVYFNKSVLVNNIEADPLWEEYREAAKKSGYKACWASPITTQNEKALGAFSIYFKECMKTNQRLIDMMERLASLIAVAIVSVESEKQLNYQAKHDNLTSLINRYEFESQIEKLLVETKNTKATHALCFMDLDQFKVVNDTCGHSAGDELLSQLSDILQNNIRSCDTLARLGGDEFGLLVLNCDLNLAMFQATRILHAIKEYQFTWEDNIFRIGISIGLVEITDETHNFNELFRKADAACYVAKDLGRNRIHVYSSSDHNLSVRQGEMQWVSSIHNALQNDLFVLHAQEIQPLDNTKSKHFELLIRMDEGDGKLIPPGAFLPAAERYNLSSKIDRWVINKALQLISRSQFLKDNDVLFSINLSGHSITELNFLSFVIQTIASNSVNASNICFEITETTAISNLSSANKFISTLKDLGCKFSLDDFGSGISSFGYLKNLSVDYLKIDGMFVKDIQTDPIDHAMVKSINEIGHVIGMQTIAEFVENDEIKDMLKLIGVDYVQGYGIGKPSPLMDLLQ